MNQRMQDEFEKLLKGQKRRPMYKVLLQFAVSYARAAQLISAETMANPDMSAPLTMCQFFSLELLLKFFVLVDHRSVYNKKDLDTLGVDLHGHRYTVLYDKVALGHRRRMAAAYSEISGKSTTDSELRDILAAVGGEPSIGDDPFAKWRYIYENTAQANVYLDFRLLLNVTNAFGKCAQDTLKTL